MKYIIKFKLYGLYVSRIIISYYYKIITEITPHNTLALEFESYQQAENALKLVELDLEAFEFEIIKKGGNENA